MRETRKVNYNFKNQNPAISICNFTSANSHTAPHAHSTTPSTGAACIQPSVKLPLAMFISLASHLLCAYITPNPALERTPARPHPPKPSHIAAYAYIYFTDFNYITKRNIQCIFCNRR